MIRGELRRLDGYFHTYQTGSIGGNCTRVFPVQVNTIEAMSGHELSQASDECLPVDGTTDHVAECILGSGPAGAEVSATNRYPRLEAWLFTLEASKAVIELRSVVIHLYHFESVRIEINKSKVDMCEVIESQVFGPDSLALTRVGPGLVVTNVQLGCCILVLSARWTIGRYSLG